MEQRGQGGRHILGFTHWLKGDGEGSGEPVKEKKKKKKKKAASSLASAEGELFFSVGGGE